MPRFLSSWVGLAVLALGASLLVFPVVPARDMAGRPLGAAPLPWPITAGCLVVGIVLLAIGRREA